MIEDIQSESQSNSNTNREKASSSRDKPRQRSTQMSLRPRRRPHFDYKDGRGVVDDLGRSLDRVNTITTRDARRNKKKIELEIQRRQCYTMAQKYLKLKWKARHPRSSFTI